MKLAFATLLLTLAASAQAAPFTLVLRDTQQKIQKGELGTYEFAKSWPLPIYGIKSSREANKVSTTLTPVLDRIGAQVNARKPRPAVFKNVGGTWVATDQIGWVFDRDGTKANLLKAVLEGKNSAEVAYKRVVPERSVQVLYDRGVRWFVTTGESSYEGSPSFRVRNILVGADKLDNFFIAPDHTFDFGKEVGQIDASTGFVKGFVISGGTLAKEDGGGICQVSTTIFRALYQAGLPVVERHDHSHRVEYYDPVGFEATVYVPEKNLRMKNDTGAHLFIQARWNKADEHLYFDVFGANTGRDVSISKPVVTDFKPPASPSYTPDKRVRLGGQRLLDVPVQGMTSTITRTIKVNGKKVGGDVLKSVYKPWGAVYGVNPRDRRLN